MFKKLTLASAAFAMGVAALVPATPAMAQRYDRGYSSRHYNDGYYNQRSYRGRGGDYRNYRNYRGGQRCKDGDGGTVIGAIAGGLAGHEIARDRTMGTILGGVVGAVAGRAIDRSDRPNYCR